MNETHVEAHSLSLPFIHIDFTSLPYWCVSRREWMGMRVAGIILNEYHGSFPHSLLSRQSTSKLHQDTLLHVPHLIYFIWRLWTAPMEPMDGASRRGNSMPLVLAGENHPVYMGVFINGGTQKWMVYNKKKQNEWFRGTPVWGNLHIFGSWELVQN